MPRGKNWRKAAAKKNIQDKADVGHSYPTDIGHVQSSVPLGVGFVLTPTTSVSAGVILDTPVTVVSAALPETINAKFSSNTDSKFASKPTAKFSSKLVTNNTSNNIIKCSTTTPTNTSLSYTETIISEMSMEKCHENSNSAEKIQRNRKFQNENMVFATHNQGDFHSTSQSNSYLSQSDNISHLDEDAFRNIDGISASNVDNAMQTSDVTLFASHSQSDFRYSVFSRGSQCTCMSLSMILSLQQGIQLSTNTLDLVLHHGDNLYRNAVLDLQVKGKFVNKLLSYQELPLAVQYREDFSSVIKHTIVYGLPVIQSHNLEVFSLHDGIVFALTKSESLLIMIGAICSAIIFKDGKYLLFDSHSHGSDGLSSSDGKALLKMFSCIDDLVLFLYSFYSSCNIDLESQFEILPVTVERISHSFFDFEQNSVERLTSRKKYMREYMQKKRENNNFRCKELQDKQKARLHEQYRDEERKREVFCKRKARDNSQYRDEEKQRELTNKRKARDNSQYREVEKQRELSSKRKSRLDQFYKEKEVLGKRKARDDTQYREVEKQRELSSKRKSRLDQFYKEKEVLAKRKARDDSQYREEEKQRELSSKRKSRLDQFYKEKEVLAKRKARDDSQYREEEKQRELSSKRKSRLDQFYKEKEVLAKRKARDDSQYREEEKQRELSSNKKARSNSFYKEKERMKRQQNRKEKAKKTNNEKLVDRKRKINMRSNQNYMEKEKETSKKKKYGSNIEECIEIFHASTSNGPVYVSSCCHQTWFHDSVCKVENISSDVEFQPGILTELISEQGKEWICRTCLSNVKKNRVPKLSVLNGMKWPIKPTELNLHPMEERVVALRIPFMQMRELPRGGQYCVKGNVVNVPVDIQPVINALPRQMDDTGTIPIKLKKKMSYKTCDFKENIRPTVVLSALHWLMSGSDLYKNSGIQIDESWEQSVSNDSRDIVREFVSNEANGTISDVSNDDTQRTDSEKSTTIDTTGYESDNYSEVDSTENVTGNADTLLEDESMNTDKSYTFAPGEGQHPLSLYTDHDAEYLSFPSIFCGQRRPNNKERLVPVHYSDIAKWELRSQDRRAAQSVPNIFFKLKKIQLKQISDKVHLAVRRIKTKGQKSLLHKPEINQHLIKLYV